MTRATSRAVFKQHAWQDQSEGHGQCRGAIRGDVRQQIYRRPPPMETNSTRALAASKRKKPGIIEATAEKASAAKGRCRRSAEADHEHADAGVDPASDAKRDPRAYEINRAVEKMRTRHQHHARTECNESVKCSVDTGGKFPAN